MVRSLLLVTSAALLPLLASSALLRSHPPLQTHHAGRCGGRKSMQLLSTDAANIQGGIFYDGFSRVACEMDASPASVRIDFMEHACGQVASCRLKELPMEPRLCFDFCRTQASAKFFGLAHGRDCYCTTYFHAKSTGEGVCNTPCAGDSREMCGGMEKSSLFEMHMCSDSKDEAAMAQNHSTEALSSATALKEMVDTTVVELRALAEQHYQLDVCSIVPEGQRVCHVKQGWLSEAAQLGKASADLGNAMRVLNTTAGNLTSLQDGYNAPENSTAAAASSLELATASAFRQASKLEGVTSMAKMAIAHVGGPLAQDQLGALTEGQRKTVKEVFRPLAHANNSWSGICALVPIPGEAYTALAGSESWQACAHRCLQLSTGTGACVAFNFQFKSDSPEFAACQLLKEEGLVEPSIAKAVPVFEVAQQTVESHFRLKSMACYAKSGWMAGHPRGPLGTHIVRSISI